MKFAEIGTFEGKTTRNLLTRKRIIFERYILIDPYQTYASYNDSSFDIRADSKMLLEAKSKIIPLVESNSNVTLITEYSSAAAPQFDNEYFDAVFIDANHTYASVKQDVILWLPKVRNGGFLIGHDFGYPGLDGVKQAVNEILGDDYSIGDDFVWSHKKEEK